MGHIAILESGAKSAGASMRSTTLLACELCVESKKTILEWLLKRVSDVTPTVVCTVNPEMLLRARQDRGFRDAISQADLCVADGIGVIWAAKYLNGLKMERYPGIDLVNDLIKHLAGLGHSVYLLGSRPGVAVQAAERLVACHQGLSIAGCQHGYFSPIEEPGIVNSIAACRPSMLVVGLGSPLQEEFILRNKAQLCCSVMVGAGGSLEVFAGTKRRAPLWLRRMGLEWAWRAILDRSRWSRNMSLLGFVSLVLRSRWERHGGEGD